MSRRILSLWLPRAAAESMLRRERLAADTPLAVLAEERGALRVLSATAAAERMGVRCGQSAADARAVYPQLVTRMGDPGAQAALTAALLRWAQRFCPWAAEDWSGAAGAPFGVARARAGRGASGGLAFGRQRSAQPASDDPDMGGAPPLKGELCLALDVTGSTHLFGGETALAPRLLSELQALGFSAQAGLADGLGAAWALARYGANAAGWAIAEPGQARKALGRLSPACLRLEPKAVEGLARLGVGTVEALAALPRGAVSRRFGPGTLRRIDQAFGSEPEPIAPQRAPAPHAVRLSLPEPIGRLEDVRAGLDRLLERLCGRLTREGLGVRRLVLELRRSDRSTARVEAAMARPERDAARIARLFERPLQGVDAGYGVDGMRLEAVWVDRVQARQIAAPSGAGRGRGAASGTASTMSRDGPRSAEEVPEARRQGAVGGGAEATGGAAVAALRALTWSAAQAEGAGDHGPPPGDAEDRMAALLTSLGGRLGFDRLLRFAPAASHLPDHAAVAFSAAYGGSDPAERADWASAAASRPPRPLMSFAPEPVSLEARSPHPRSGAAEQVAGDAVQVRARDGRGPPSRFQWRGRRHEVAATAGPERIAPEWWWDAPAWRSGVRDYWRVETKQGARLWLFQTPEAAAETPRWFVAGRFA